MQNLFNEVSLDELTPEEINAVINAAEEFLAQKTKQSPEPGSPTLNEL
jgi:hypothetical protein